MTLNIRNIRNFRSVCVTLRNYSEKSIYRREEEGPKPREVYGQPYPEWRKPWIQRKGEWKSKLSIFVEKNPSPDLINAMSQIPDLSFEKIRIWWFNMKVKQEIHNQQYLPERVAKLGSNLAAMHFFLYRQCTVRLKNSTEWIKGDVANLNIPETFEEGYFVEAIDCSEFHHNGIRYEGLKNLWGLGFLKWLSLKNNKNVDIWCIDRLAGQNGHTIEYLDISGCNICVGSVLALARMPALKYLVLTDPGNDVDFQATLSILEQENPRLLIKTV